MSNDFEPIAEYRGFELGTVGDIIPQGYIKLLPYGIPLKARYGETVEGLMDIVDELMDHGRSAK